MGITSRSDLLAAGILRAKRKRQMRCQKLGQGHLLLIKVSMQGHRKLQEMQRATNNQILGYFTCMTNLVCFYCSDICHFTKQLLHLPQYSFNLFFISSWMIWWGGGERMPKQRAIGAVASRVKTREEAIPTRVMPLKRAMRRPMLSRARWQYLDGIFGMFYIISIINSRVYLMSTIIN